MSASVLFADDSPSVRMIVNAILQTLEVQTIECKDGVEAIEYLQAHKVDVILLDLNMPRADGVEVTLKARENHSPNQFTPIVMLTTETGNDHKREGRDAGVTAWVEKPFEARVLLKVVNKCLKMKRS